MRGSLVADATMAVAPEARPCAHDPVPRPSTAQAPQSTGIGPTLPSASIEPFGQGGGGAAWPHPPAPWWQIRRGSFPPPGLGRISPSTSCCGRGMPGCWHAPQDRGSSESRPPGGGRKEPPDKECSQWRAPASSRATDFPSLTLMSDHLQKSATTSKRRHIVPHTIGRFRAQHEVICEALRKGPHTRYCPVSNPCCPELQYETVADGVKEQRRQLVPLL